MVTTLRERPTADDPTPEPTGFETGTVPTATYLTGQWTTVATGGLIGADHVSIVIRASGERWNPGGVSA
ncbi:MAG: hypothetical protein HGA51_01565 [Demequinaceae bacterium]|nr:hypothetical protein [Demequinaceae bacterium]